MTSFKKSLPLVILCFLSLTGTGQKSNDFYTSFSESGISQHTLNFDENGIVRAGSIRRHMSPYYVAYGSYEKRGDYINIKMDKINFIDLQEAKKFGFESFSEMELTLYKYDSELIDSKTRTVYVTSRKLNRKKIKRKSIAFINGKKYLYERLVTDGYGLIRREPRKNKRFEKVLAKVLQHPNEYETKVIHGLTAYQEFGLIGINGVSVMNKKTKHNKDYK